MNPNRPSSPNRRRARIAGGAAAAAGLIGLMMGADSIGSVVDSVREHDRQFVEHPSHQASESQKYAVAVGIDGMQKKLGADAPQVGGEPAPVRDTYKAKNGDNLWDLTTHHLVDDEGQAIDPNDAREYVDTMTPQIGADGLQVDEEVLLPEGTHYTEVDTNPAPTTTQTSQDQ